MLLAGMFSGGNHCFGFTPTNISKINNIKISHGIFDGIYCTKSVINPYHENSKIWNFDTILYALFQNNLFCGNVQMTKDTVSSIRIKRRKINEHNWDVLFEIPIIENEDFTFERFDRYARGSTEYQYALVPVADQVEGDFSTASIKSEFEGFYFVEKDTILHAFINTQLSTTRNQNSTTISTIGRKYPFHITNGINNFESGQLQATFINDVNCELDIVNGWKYRELVDDFLSSSSPKIFKNAEGKMWMVAIVDNIPQDFSQHWQMPIHTISWVEIGDCENVDDLYDNNFIDLDPRLVR